MAIIATLNTIFTAETQQFDKGVNKMQGGIGMLRGGVAKALPGMASFGNNMMALGATGGVVAGVMKVVGDAIAFVKFHVELATDAFSFLTTHINASLQSLDRLAKQSQRTGLTVQTMQAIGVGAELAGANVAGLDKAMVRMQRTLVDAQFGLSTAVRAFDLIGLSTSDLARMSPDDQLRAIADGLGRVAIEEERTAAATAIFGRSGAELIPLFQDGFAAVDDATRILRKWGVEVSGEQISAVEEFNDRVTELGVAFKGLFDVMAIQIGPFIAAGMIELLKTLVGIKDVILVATQGMKSWSGVGNFLLSVFKSVFDVLKDTAMTILGIMGIAIKFGRDTGTLSAIGLDDEGAQSILNAIGTMRVALRETTFDALSDSFKKTLAELQSAMDKHFAESASKSEAARLGAIAEAAFANLRGMFSEEAATGFMDIFGSVGEAFAKVARSGVDAFLNFKGPKVGRTPDIGALQQGTAAAFKAVNEARKSDKAAKDASRTAKATEETATTTRSILSALKTGIGFGLAD